MPRLVNKVVCIGSSVAKEEHGGIQLCKTVVVVGDVLNHLVIGYDCLHCRSRSP